MAKCEEGYLCDVCGGDVEAITDSDLYLRFVIGEVDPETLHTTRERHIRCNPVLAQFIVDDDFEPVTVAGVFDKRQLDALYVRQRETLVTRGWRRLTRAIRMLLRTIRIYNSGKPRIAGQEREAINRWVTVARRGAARARSPRYPARDCGFSAAG